MWQESPPEIFEETGLQLDKEIMYKYVNICNTCYYIYTLDCAYIPMVNDNTEIAEAAFINIEKKLPMKRFGNHQDCPKKYKNRTFW